MFSSILLRGSVMRPIDHAVLYLCTVGRRVSSTRARSSAVFAPLGSFFPVVVPWEGTWGGNFHPGSTSSCMSLPEIFDIAASVFSYSPKLCRDVSVVWICSLLVVCFWGSRALCELGTHWRCSPPSCLGPLRGGSPREHSTHCGRKDFSISQSTASLPGNAAGPC